MMIHDLPPQPTPFIGRGEELTQIAALFAKPACRLVTLVGPGGIGKTRLALEAAQLQRDRFPYGVYFVPLQPLRSPDFIVSTIADAVGFQFYTGSDPKKQLLDYFSEKALLLVLDNFEHLLDGAGLVSEVLAYASAVKILATSRERLNLMEEWVLDVPGLPVPASEAEIEIDGYDAVQLFLQNAQRVAVGFILIDAQKSAVSRICRLVGGMPLGIELAAAWVRTLSCEDIASEIEHDLDLLATSARNVPPRHRTMRAVLDHSWDLLTPLEREVFQKLSVFRGGFRKEAAHSVAGASLQTLSALVDKSLLRVDASGRYEVHELLWQYAREKLTAADETKVAQDRHRDYFLMLVETTEPEFSGANQIDWLNRIEIELGNVRAAIAWSLECGDIAASLQLTGSLYWFWSLRGYHREDYEQLMDILSLPSAKARTAVRARALNAAGVIQWFEGQNAKAYSLLEEAEAIAREVKDQRELALTVRFLGPVQYSLGEYEAAARVLEESLLLARELQDRYGIAWSLHFLGDVMLQQGQPERAQSLYEESMDLVRALKEKGLLALVTRRLGFVMRSFQDYERAEVLGRESLTLNLAMADRRAVAASLVGLAGLAVEQGHVVHATQLLGAAERFLTDSAAHLLFIDQLEYERLMRHVRSQLDASTFNQAWADGQAMTMEQAASHALENSYTRVAVGRPKQTDDAPQPESLTTRELEILHLMAQGMSNRDIAESLILSVGTVKWYGSQICTKLYARNRVQAIARARELHILP